MTEAELRNENFYIVYDYMWDSDRWKDFDETNDDCECFYAFDRTEKRKDLVDTYGSR